MSKTEIQSLHQEIAGRTMDAKLASFWEIAIRDGNKTLKNLEDVLLMSDDHVKRAVQLFKESYYDLIDYELSDEVTQRFIDTHAKGKRVTPTIVREYVISLPEFEDKICKIFYIHKGGERPCKATLNYFLQKFKEDPKYRIEDLGEDILNEKSINITSDTHKEAVVPEEAKVMFETTTLDRNFVVAFEEAFKRPMFVHEYFKYGRGLTNNDFHEVYKEHMTKYNRLRQVMCMYTGRHIDEYDYIKQYLDAVDEDNFFFDIIDEIVASEDYRMSMSQHLKERYNKMFDDELEQYDIDYVFEKVRIEKLSLEDDQVNEILVSLKSETDDIVKHIFAIYLKVLMREPEVEEVHQFTRKYRSMLPKNLEDIDRDTEKLLMSSLEFHDILKSIVRARYAEANCGKNISMSKLYDMLNVCLTKINGCNMDEVGDIVTLVLSQQ